MLPTLRSVIAQVPNRGGRSIRNFSASSGSIESAQGVIRKCLTVAAGYVIGYFALNGYARKLDEIQAENLRSYEEELRQFEARRLNQS